MKFYADVRQLGSKVLVREVDNGHQKNYKTSFEPTLYVKGKGNFKSLTGEKLKPVHFQSIKEAKEFNETYQYAENYQIYGNQKYAYQWVTDNYEGEIDFDFTQLHIVTIDIETKTEDGFPDVMSANEELLLITLQDLHTKEKITFGTREYTGKYQDKLKHAKGFTYVQCENERDLIKRFLSVWTGRYPHVLTGWNIKFFDVPYLYHRISRVMGEETANLLSPWKKLRERDVEMYGRTNRSYEVYGISTIDYLDAYKKYGFTDKAPENYKLDTIGEAELGRPKLKNPYPTFKQFYENDWDLFVIYNCVDCEIVDELEDAKKLILLMVSVGYIAKVNAEDVFSPVKVWEAIVHNHLNPRGIILPGKKYVDKKRIEGAYVKEVPPSFHEWIISFDAASLYPSIIISLNMSPETLSSHVVDGISVDGLLAEQYDLSELKDMNLAMAANGYTYSRDNAGVFPALMDMMMSKRKVSKNKMLDYSKKIEEIEEELKRRK